MAMTPSSKTALGLSFTPTHRTAPYPSLDLALSPPFTVLITGASRGIGKAIAKAFVRARVSGIVLLARNGEELEDLKGELLYMGNKRAVSVVTFVGDVADGGFVEGVAREVRESFGGVDCLVNNAGYLPPSASIQNEDPASHWLAFETNYKGTYNLMHYFLPLLKASPAESPKTIINIISWGIIKPIRQNSAAYYTSKTAVARLSELLAIEEPEIVVVAVHPGGVRTDMTKESPEALQPWLVDSPDLAAGVCVWLAKVQRKWLSGRYVSANWDVDELERKRKEIVEKDLLKPKYAFE